MIQTIIGILVFLAFCWYFCFYIWYLFWPIAEATIEKISEGQLIAPGTSYTKRHRVIVYTFEYKGKKYRSTRQGLITAKGWAKDYLLQETFELKICSKIIELSCPKRIFFETILFVFWSIVILFTAYAFYNQMYGY